MRFYFFQVHENLGPNLGPSDIGQENKPCNSVVGVTGFEPATSTSQTVSFAASARLSPAASDRCHLRVGCCDFHRLTLRKRIKLFSRADLKRLNRAASS